MEHPFLNNSFKKTALKRSTGDLIERFLSNSFNDFFKHFGRHGMSYFWSNFRTNPFFLLRYFLVQTFAALGIIFLVNKFSLGLDVHFDSIPYYLLPVALLIGIKVPTMMHNCFHKNFKKFNFIIGELTSFFVLMGFGIMCVNHTFHHSFADTDSDPHRPEGKSFFIFFLTAIFGGIKIIEKRHLEFHGKTLKNQITFKVNIFLHLAGVPLKALTWYYLLGQELFLYLYIPSFIFYLFSFAHVNYVTHETNQKGESIILNKNSNAWYQFVNLVGDGVYFHKNHHHNPSLYNPKNYNLGLQND